MEISRKPLLKIFKTDFLKNPFKKFLAQCLKIREKNRIFINIIFHIARDNKIYFKQFNMSCGHSFTADTLSELSDDSFCETSSPKKDFMKGALTLQINDKVIPLNRGGCIVKTTIGPIQFGMPPETVKDSMSMGLEVPTYYIIPTNRFDKNYGVNVAEFEFPAYFNFFIKKKHINLICTKEAEKAIRIVFQETLIGPEDHSVTLDLQKRFNYFRIYKKIFIPVSRKKGSQISKKKGLTSLKTH